MTDDKKKFSDNQIQQIIISVFLILVMTIIYIKILFF
jgi:hypothetical protein